MIVLSIRVHQTAAYFAVYDEQDALLHFSIPQFGAKSIVTYTFKDKTKRLHIPVCDSEAAIRVFLTQYTQFDLPMFDICTHIIDDSQATLECAIVSELLIDKLHSHIESNSTLASSILAIITLGQLVPTANQLVVFDNYLYQTSSVYVNSYTPLDTPAQQKSQSLDASATNNNQLCGLHHKDVYSKTVQLLRQKDERYKSPIRSISVIYDHVFHACALIDGKPVRTSSFGAVSPTKLFGVDYTELVKLKKAALEADGDSAQKLNRVATLIAEEIAKLSLHTQPLDVISFSGIVFMAHPWLVQLVCQKLASLQVYCLTIREKVSKTDLTAPGSLVNVVLMQANPLALAATISPTYFEQYQLLVEVQDVQPE